ncbi:CopG family transcriptional regulator [Bradyrhizobium sp. BRP20]|uniref:dolichyl-diphosphooligosaccharide--protein glycosyltransferase subunit 2 n=1 Tax=unclassified Bradyrhizobium TaxID=2631580 RepID=UPI001CD44D94|nr:MULTISPECIES: dolichyl-diphosphooligosaccharide--protein glycosyltransferase subunit 2 [unclassified Bradyrhizobium]MCA1437235.1 CopG family transcriptional regulator [Bradyrhizobium sp. BRP20]MCA1472541.1 CopG family transcriptional regulator [Bradyrhizobium sp. IC3195]MCA1551320.1 CopG family transcriptional regulator [Bradyrhizobium sp. BRP19]
MTAAKKKAQMSVYLDPDVMKALSAYAARREQSLSLIAEAAIASFLSPDADERREAAVTKRLDQIDRRVARLERDVGISVETVALFIRFWLATTPPLPEPAAKAAKAQGGARWDNFVAVLGRRLSQGPKLRQEIPDDMDGIQPSARHERAESDGK